MRIKAAVLRGEAAPFSLESIDLESPRANEVLVRIEGVGVCHTDVKVQHGVRPIPHPIVLGHEGSGVVEEVGSAVTKVQPGDRVVLTYNSCGICPNCQNDQAAYCLDVVELTFGGKRADGSSPLSQNGEVVHGCFFGQSSFADYAMATERNVVKVDRDVPLELLGPLGCGIQTGAGAVLNSLAAKADSSILIIGTGSVGLSALMGAVVAGCSTIIAVDINPQRLALAGELGATHTIDGAETDDLVAAVQAICAGGVNYSLDTTGVPALLRQAVECLAILGSCAHIGGGAADAQVEVPMRHLLLGRTLRGVVQGDSVPDIFIPRLIDLYLSGRFPFDRLISFYQLEDINQAIDDMHHGKAIKPVLQSG
ncbi:MAG: alcohol dehydrogenase catalytic domain-containing protein [Candidatus Latescibacteria bacterium]|nr:alcohol dehydrogenase catalytic domain-containing protein [Candidatus Latescibacterota bacterium]